MEAPEDIDSLAEDWIALWQSEIAGLAADPELALGAAWMRAAATGAPRFRGAGPHDGPASPPRPPPAAAPSGAGGDARDGGGRDAARDAMAARLAELERRLADLEGGAGGKGADPRRPRGRRPRA